MLASRVSLLALKGRNVLVLKIRDFAALGKNFRANAPQLAAG